MFRWFAVLLLLIVPGCGGDTPTRNNDFTPVTSIQLVQPLGTIVENTSIQLRAIGDFSGLFTRDITDEVVWSSSDAGIASFALRPGTVGRVQGVVNGTATLTATAANGVSAAIDQTVVTATLTTIAVTPLDPTVPRGLTRAFTASGHFDDGSLAGIDQEITFDVVWSSSAPTIAAVSNTATTPGLASALAEGTATITAAPSWSAVTGSSLMTVTPAALQSITLSPDDGALLTLYRRAFTATGHFSDGSQLPVTAQVAWSSSNSAVASIDAAGVVSGLLEGTTSIGASLSGVNAATPLQVTGGNLTGMTVTPANPSLAVSTSRRMTATGSFSNGTQRDITRNVTWSLLTPVVGSISNLGDDSGKLQTSATVGTSQVQALSGSINGQTALSVHAGVLSTLAIAPVAAESLLTGTSRPLKVTASYANGESQDLTEDATWSSDNPAVATVVTSGLTTGTVTGIAAGTVNLTAARGTPSDSVAITVATGTPVGLTIAPLIPTLASGGSVQLTATADFGGGVTRDVTRDASWSSDNLDVAVEAHDILHPGLFYGVRAGTAVVTATFASQSSTTTLTVQ